MACCKTLNFVSMRLFRMSRSAAKLGSNFFPHCLMTENDTFYHATITFKFHVLYYWLTNYIHAFSQDRMYEFQAQRKPTIFAVLKLWTDKCRTLIHAENLMCKFILIAYSPIVLRNCKLARLHHTGWSQVTAPALFPLRSPIAR